MEEVVEQGYQTISQYLAKHIAKNLFTDLFYSTGKG